MGGRFFEYLRIKGISQKKLSELSHVSPSLVSRFCSGGNISSDNLQKLLFACDDLSLYWLFFGTGDMFRSREGVTVNMGSFAGAEMATNDSLIVKNSSGARVQKSSTDRALVESLMKKDELIAEKDRIISQRDETISNLYRALGSR